MIDRKMIGGILLIGGTAIGAGMLALPVALAKAGFWPAMGSLLLVWAYMTFSAYLLLEANLRLPRHCNIISMVRATMGKPAEVIAWSVYLLLLYTLLSAYISGGSDLIDTMLQLLNVHVPRWLSALSFVAILGGVIACGISIVDVTNRWLMISKITLYMWILFTVAPHVSVTHWMRAQPTALLGVLPVLVTAYGFSIILPTLRSYLQDDVKKIRITLFVGSILPLIIYVSWVGAILGTIPHSGPKGLMAILGTPHEVTLLAQRLQESLNQTGIGDLFRAFSTISLLTAFLGVSYSLTDFLADGFNLRKQGWQTAAILVLAFVPPLAVVWLNPSLFVMGLNYAGLCVIFLMSLMPAIMVWIGRYHRSHHVGYQVIGGKPLLIICILASCAILAYTAWGTFH